MLITSVTASGVGQQRHDNDVLGERGALFSATAASPHLPLAARAAPTHGRHLPESGCSVTTTPRER